MDKIFTKHELEVLDDVMPESIKKKIEEADEVDEDSLVNIFWVFLLFQSKCCVRARVQNSNASNITKLNVGYSWVNKIINPVKTNMSCDWPPQSQD